MRKWRVDPTVANYEKFVGGVVLSTLPEVEVIGVVSTDDRGGTNNMKINDIRIREEKEFGRDLRTGDVFFDEYGKLLMMVDMPPALMTVDDSIPAVALADGCMYAVGNNDKVKVVEVECNVLHNK